MPAVTEPLPFAWGGPAATGRLRDRPEDFQVEECLTFEPAGNGDHALLRIRKRGENTEWVARRLADVTGVPRRDVGYAGLKDRHAETTQWFSVGLAGGTEPDWEAMVSESVELVEVTRHTRKLRPGAVAENHFRLCVRGLAGDPEAVVARLEALRDRGAPNYFGEQRFGRDGNNLERARALFAGRLRVRDRKLRGIYLSAARSWIFNALLADRVASSTWNQCLEGDVMNLDGRSAVFAAETVDEVLQRRLERLEIHPTGPMWGRGVSMATGEPAQLERDTAAAHAELASGMEQAGMKQERRALRTAVRRLEWSLDGEVLVLAFALPSGSYATAVLREVVDYGLA